MGCWSAFTIPDVPPVLQAFLRFAAGTVIRGRGARGGASDCSRDGSLAGPAGRRAVCSGICLPVRWTAAFYDVPRHFGWPPLSADGAFRASHMGRRGAGLHFGSALRHCPCGADGDVARACWR